MGKDDFSKSAMAILIGKIENHWQWLLGFNYEVIIEHGCILCSRKLTWLRGGATWKPAWENGEGAKDIKMKIRRQERLVVIFQRGFGFWSVWDAKLCKVKVCHTSPEGPPGYVVKLAQLCNPTAKGSSKVPGLFRFFGACIFVSPVPWPQRLKPNRFAVGNFDSCNMNPLEFQAVVRFG